MRGRDRGFSARQGGPRLSFWRPVRAWHLALLPLLLVANYFLLVLRHEGSHALVVLLFGGEIAELHLWPPRAGNLSWITLRFPDSAPAMAVPLQAAAPYVVALGMIAAGLYYSGWKLPSGLLRANVVVTAVLFPCAELGMNIVSYWYGRNDIYYLLGTATTPARWLVTAGGAALMAASLGIATQRLLLGSRDAGQGRTCAGGEARAEGGVRAEDEVRAEDGMRAEGGMHAEGRTCAGDGARAEDGVPATRRADRAERLALTPPPREFADRDRQAWSLLPAHGQKPR